MYILMNSFHADGPRVIRTPEMYFYARVVRPCTQGVSVELIVQCYRFWLDAQNGEYIIKALNHGINASTLHR